MQYFDTLLVYNTYDLTKAVEAMKGIYSGW